MRLFPILIASLAFAASVAKADPPDYLGQGERMDLYARVISSGASCKQFDFDVAGFDQVAIAKRAVNEAIMAGIDSDVATRLLNSAYEREDANQTALSKNIGQGSRNLDQLKDDTRVFLAYWLDRCTALADDPTASRFIRHTTREREQAAFARQMDAIAKKIDKAGK